MKKGEKREIFATIAKLTEADANIIVSYLMFGIAGLYIGGWILFLFKVYTIPSFFLPLMIGTALVIILTSSIVLMLKGRGKLCKYFLFIALLLSAMEFNMITGFKLWLSTAIPIILSCRYYNKKFTLATGLLTIAIIIYCSWCNAFFGPKIGLFDLNVVNFDKAITLWNKIPLSESVAKTPEDFKSLLINSMRLLAIPNILVTIIITILCYVIINHGQSLILQTMNAGDQKARLENEVAASRTKNMMSQIQPHFIFNTLTAIMAIDGNPDETIEAIATFGRYLRENLNTLSDDDLIDFKKEMEHVQVYVSLEQLRFKDKVKIDYDLEVVDFKIPSLTIQILVENSIKHGITRKKEGGTVLIQSKETDSEYLIIVQDNGIGFDPVQISKESNHVGMKNIKARLSILSKGFLEVQTAIDEGTKATVHIPKNPNNK